MFGLPLPVASGKLLVEPIDQEEYPVELDQLAVMLEEVALVVRLLITGIGF